MHLFKLFLAALFHSFALSMFLSSIVNVCLFRERVAMNAKHLLLVTQPKVYCAPLVHIIAMVEPQSACQALRKVLFLIMSNAI